MVFSAAGLSPSVNLQLASAGMLDGEHESVRSSSDVQNMVEPKLKAPCLEILVICGFCFLGIPGDMRTR